MKALSLDEVHVDRLIEQTIKAGCKELHLRVGQSPYTSNCNAELLSPMPEYQAFNRLEMQQMIYAILSDEQIIQLQREEKSAFSYSVAKGSLTGLGFGVRCAVEVFLSANDMRTDLMIEPSEF